MFGNYSSPYGYNSMPTATQPYGYPMNTYPPVQTPVQTPTQTNTNMIFVNGLEDVKQRPQPNNSVMLYADNDKAIVYKKTVDGKGQYNVETFDIAPHKEEIVKTESGNFVPRTEFEALQKKISVLEDTVAMLIPAKTEEVKTDGTNNS